MIETTIVIVVLGAYLLGSIPVAWLVCKWVTGEDIRCLGSGNVGVMNTALSAARWAGLLVFLAEIAKGILAVIVPRLLVSGEWADLAVGLSVIAVVAGTRWPVWLRFQGGRGNTAGISALTLISFQTGVLLICIWFVLRLLTKSSFLTTRLTLLLLPIAVWVGTQSWWYALVGLALSVIYLSTQRQTSDDHLLLKEDWPSFWAFLTSPPRKSS